MDCLESVYYWKNSGDVEGELLPVCENCGQHELLAVCGRHLADAIEIDLLHWEEALLDVLALETKIQIRCHVGLSVKACEKKLKLRRKYYKEGLYHTTLIFQQRPDGRSFISVEFLLRRSQDDILPPPLNAED